MEKWLVYAKKDNFDEIGEQFKISPVISRIIRNRDVVGVEKVDEYLNAGIDKMNSPFLLKDIDKAIEIIGDKIKEAKKIRVISDYDIDGICSAYILVNGLKKLNAIVDLKIPDRVSDGYGINEAMVENAFDSGISTIITCDNGIAAVDAVKRAKELGMTVIITDHHEIPFNKTWKGIEYILPEADAIINPKQVDCNYPFKMLCGAGVAYKLIQALSIDCNIKNEDIIKYLEYVAIATIGDIVDLKGENRIITKFGLKLLNSTTNPGLQSLIEVNNLKGKEITSYHIGFALGPCLNAAGRLDTAKKAFDMLCEKNKDKALNIAKELAELNKNRKEMTEKGVELAKQDIETFVNLPVLVIYLPDCHESVAGIIAGRIKEMCYRPTIVLTSAKEGVKGSGRSIDGYDMFKELSKCKSILTKFGGHEMAAGLSLKEEHIDLLRKMLNRNIVFDENVFTKKMWIDVPLPFEYVSQSLVEQLSVLEPFGKGNEKPSFGEKNISIVKLKIVGQNQNVVKLDLINQHGCRINGVCFDSNKNFVNYLIETYGQEEYNKASVGIPSKIRLSIIYYPTINEYNGNRNVEIIINNYK